MRCIARCDCQRSGAVVSGEIKAAEQRYRDRVDAAGVADTAMRGASEDEAEAAVRRMLSGFDLDIDELKEVLGRRHLQASMAMVISGAPALTCATFFSEGIAVGLLLAEARQREEAR
jgi:hypothetical protein